MNVFTVVEYLLVIGLYLSLFVMAVSLVIEEVTHNRRIYDFAGFVITLVVIQVIIMVLFILLKNTIYFITY